MKRYAINVLLSNGDKVEAKSVGENQADALEKLTMSEQFQDFVGDNIVENINIVLLGDVVPVNPDNYAIQDKGNDEYIVADKVNMVMITFTKGDFNNTAKTTDLNNHEITDALRIATIQREISEYLSEYHNELI